MKPRHPVAVIAETMAGHRYVYTATSQRHARTIRALHLVHAASLRALSAPSRDAPRDKQDPPPPASDEGSNRSTSGATDGRAASAQCDRAARA